jgi:hypothetical protein
MPRRYVDRLNPNRKSSSPGDNYNSYQLFMDGPSGSDMLLPLGLATRLPVALPALRPNHHDARRIRRVPQPTVEMPAAIASLNRLRRSIEYISDSVPRKRINTGKLGY